MPVIRRIRFSSDRHYGRRRPPVVGWAITALPALMADAVSMAFCRRRTEYVSVPMAPVKKVRVTYLRVGSLKPMPYSLDE